MRRAAIKLLIRRIRKVKYQIKNESQRIKHIADSCKYRTTLKDLEQEHSRLIKFFHDLRSTNPSYTKKVMIYIDCIKWTVMERLRLHKLKKTIMAKDVQHVHDLIEKENENPQNYQINVQILKIENKRSEVVGDRTIEVENLCTSKSKVYSIDREASNYWYMELTEDIKKGYFKKAG